MSTDPRVIILILDDVAKSAERLSHDGREADRTAERLHAHCLEFHLGVTRIANSCIAESQTVMNSGQSAVAMAQFCSARTDEHERSSRASRSGAMQAKHQADEAVRCWTKQVSLAKERVGRAHAWVSRSESLRDEAVVAYNNALHRLSELEGRLQQCRQPVQDRDSNGNYRTRYRDCSGLERAVAHASHQVDAARHEVNEAESELNRARLELQSAQLWLDDCERRLSLANSAVQLATAAMSKADHSLAEVCRAREHADACTAMAGQSMSEAVTAARLAEEAFVQVHASQRLLDEALVHRRNLANATVEACSLCRDAVRLVEDRITALTEFNDPTLRGFP